MFRLPRKIKKKYRKDNIVFACEFNQECYNWFYHKDNVILESLRYIIKYPDIVTKLEVIKYLKSC